MTDSRCGPRPSVMPTIRAPRNLGQDESVVEIRSDDVQLIRLRITPRGGPGDCSPGFLRLVSIFGASVSIIGSRLVAAPPYGNDCGRYDQALYIFPSQSGPVDEVNVLNTTFADFRTTGILVAEPRLDLFVTHSRFVGRNVNAGLGIRYLGSPTTELLVRTSVFLAAPDQPPIDGILAFGSGLIRIRNNEMMRVGSGIELLGPTDGRVMGNDLTGAAPDGPDRPGILLDASSLNVADNEVHRFRRGGIRVTAGGNIIRDNDFRNNRDTDCVDTTSGGGTAGTDNLWTDDLGKEDSPNGICALP